MSSSAGTETPPKVGGDKKGVFWTGGNRIKDKNVEPTSPYCFRSTDPDKLMKVYKACITPLSEKYDGKVDYSLTIFGTLVLKHLRKHGMDSVFMFEDPIDKVEKNLIEHHPRFTIEYVKQETEKLKKECPYHKQNLEWAEQFLFDSLSTDQQVRVAKYVETSMNGPLLWMYIVLENQSDTSRALRTLVNELQQMKLTDFTGEDVKKCTSAIDQKCRRLEAAKRLPEDIGATVCSIMTTSSIEDFRIPFISKFAELDKDPTKYSYRSLIQEADSLYLSLVNSDKWLKKVSAEETALSAMMGKVEKLEQKLKQYDQGYGRGRDRGRGRGRGRDRGRSSGRNQGVSGRGDQSDIECYNCHKKGHMARNCPEKAKESNQDDKWKSMPPKKNEKHEKTVNSVKYKWCGKCSVWTDHETPEHKNPQDPQGLQAKQSTSVGGSVSCLTMGGF